MAQGGDMKSTVGGAELGATLGAMAESSLAAAGHMPAEAARRSGGFGQQRDFELCRIWNDRNRQVRPVLVNLVANTRQFCGFHLDEKLLEKDTALRGAAVLAHVHACALQHPQVQPAFEQAVKVINTLNSAACEAAAAQIDYFSRKMAEEALRTGGGSMPMPKPTACTGAEELEMVSEDAFLKAMSALSVEIAFAARHDVE